MNINSPKGSRTISLNIEPNDSASKLRGVADIIVKFGEIKILETKHERKNGLGIIDKAEFRKVEVACRTIKFDRISRYDLEGLSKDIEEIL